MIVCDCSAELHTAIKLGLHLCKGTQVLFHAGLRSNVSNPGASLETSVRQVSVTQGALPEKDRHYLQPRSVTSHIASMHKCRNIMNW
jgi:hypothetical protein